MLLAFSNLIRNAIAIDQLFVRQNPTFAILAFHQALVKHPQQVVCQLHANLLLTLGGENINNPVDRHNRAVSVHTAQHQGDRCQLFPGQWQCSHDRASRQSAENIHHNQSMIIV